MFYNSNGSVISVDRGNVFSMRIANKIVDGFKPHDVETIVSDIGKQVMVLVGEYSGSIGTVLKKDSKSVLVRMEVDYEILDLLLEQVADFEEL